MEATQMATIQAQQDYLAILKRDVQAAWLAACEADQIDPSSKFVVFTNTTEAAAYNELMGMFLRARQKFHNQVNRNRARRERHAALTSMGLKRVQGGIYE
jgi:hypothetical protein